MADFPSRNVDHTLKLLKIFYIPNPFFQEWGKDCPEFVASYKLEHDHTWTPMANVEAKEDENAIIDNILKNKSQLAIGFK